MKIQPKQRLLKRMLTGSIVAITIAFTPMIASGQDSVRDRLSPGNGADWVGEPQVETGGYAGEDSLRFSPPGPEQAWYRGADGRFFFRDQDGRQIYEEQVYRPVASADLNQRPMLGIAVQDTPQGVQIADVVPNSAAAAAGLQRGDYIVRSRQQNTTTADNFTRSIGSMRAGDPLPLTINRNGQTQDVTATLGSQPARYRSARPNLNQNFGDNNEVFSRFQRDFDEMRSVLDQLRRDVDGLKNAAGAVAKEQTLSDQ